MSKNEKNAKKKFSVWFDNDSNMTDNEKRAQIDRRLKLFYPDFTDEQIVKERENYLSSKFKYKYPMPEKRILYKHNEKMTFDKLYKLYSHKSIRYGIQDVLAPIAFLVIAGPVISIVLPALVRWDFIEYRIQALILFILIAAITLVMAVKRAENSYRKKNQFCNALEKRDIKIECLRVVDSGVHIIEDIDSSHPCFYLVLRNYNHKKNIICYCSRNEYEKYREGDYYCKVLSKEGNFLYTFHYDEWDYDEEMKSLLEKEIRKYK